MDRWGRTDPTDMLWWEPQSKSEKPHSCIHLHKTKSLQLQCLYPPSNFAQHFSNTITHMYFPSTGLAQIGLLSLPTGNRSSTITSWQIPLKFNLQMYQPLRLYPFVEKTASTLRGFSARAETAERKQQSLSFPWTTSLGETVGGKRSGLSMKSSGLFHVTLSSLI